MALLLFGAEPPLCLFESIMSGLSVRVLLRHNYPVSQKVDAVVWLALNEERRPARLASGHVLGMQISFLDAYLEATILEVAERGGVVGHTDRLPDHVPSSAYPIGSSVRDSPGLGEGDDLTQARPIAICGIDIERRGVDYDSTKAAEVSLILSKRGQERSIRVRLPGCSALSDPACSGAGISVALNHTDRGELG